MYLIFTIMIAGLIAGVLLRNHPIPMVSKATMPLIWVLLFLLGLEVGCNEVIIKALPSLGAEAFILTLAALAGSVTAAWGLYRFIDRPETRDGDGSDEREGSGAWTAVKGSLVILAFFVAGALAGAFHLFPGYDPQSSSLSFIALGCLMFSVGFGLGNDSATLRSFRSLDPRYLLLPLATIVGTLAGCALLSLVMNGRTLSDLLAVGSGFGYYSLSSVLITESKGAELGTVALLSNIIREVLTLVLAPLFARVFGPLAPISAGGATTMDTTFPVIIQSSGRRMATVSVYHGCVMDFSVPLLVMLFCS